MSSSELPVSQVMHAEILECPPATPLAEAAERMRAAGCSSIIVRQGGEPLGIWTERDALGVDFSDPGHWDAPISEHMNAPIRTLGADTTLGEAAVRFKEEHVRHFLVVDGDGESAGVITQTDVVLNHGVEWFLRLRETASVLHREPLMVPADAPLSRTVERMRQARTEAALVREDEGEWGILTERDAVEALAERRGDVPVGQLASFPLMTVAGETSLFHARNRMVEAGIRHIGVTDASGALRGLVSFEDVLDSVEYMYVEELQETLKERDQALAASQRNLRLAEKIIESSLEGILITDAQGRIESVNPAFEDVTGYSEEEVVGHKPSMLQSGRHGPEFYEAMWRELAETGSWRGEIWNRRKNGQVFPELLTITAITDEEGRTTHYAGIFSDISNLKENEERIKAQAYYDPLTDLPNRRLFDDRLAMAVAHAHRQGTRLAVLFLDLDRFKQVNDSLGHNAGDELLKTVTERLHASVREDDTVARMGGDEFIVLAADFEDPDQVAHTAQRILKAFRKPLTVQGTELHVTASIGISLYPDDGTEAETLVQNADAAMYRSKDVGRNNFSFYNEGMNVASFQHLTLENRLHKALQNDELELYFQPILELESGALAGAEALLRWHNEEMGWIPPSQFIPLAEEAGLIGEVGDWVLEAACAHLAAWQAMGRRPVPVNINLSPAQLLQEAFPAQVSAALERHGIDEELLGADLLGVEVTETALMRDREMASATLAELNRLGLKVSVDDFGTGYSSLMHLKEMPIAALKVDRSFVSGVPERDDDRAIVQAVLGLAANLGLDVVAEGVETEAQRRFLAEHHCRKVQGFLLAHPLPSEDFAHQWLDPR